MAPDKKGNPMLQLQKIGMVTECYHELFETFDSEAEFQAAMRDLLDCHVSGNWGNVGKHDWKVNEDALKTGARIVSEYNVNDVRVWIISDAAWTDNPLVREVTTFMRPEDY
jgi:hypothetical protein